MLQAILFFFKNVQVIIGLMKAAEEAFPQANFGSFKAEFVRKMLEQLDEGVTKIWPMLLKIISALVELYNDSKVFSTTTPKDGEVVSRGDVG